MFWVIFFSILISIGCYELWAWAHARLFTYLGEVETCTGTEYCYGYDAMTLPARVMCFMCGVAAITIFILTWFWVIDMIIL